MKKHVKNLLAVMTAAIAAVSSVIPASAYHYFDDEDEKNATLEKTVSINDPYLNITLDTSGINTSGMEFTLKKDGKAIGKINSSGTGITLTDKSLGIQDITGISDDKQLWKKLGSAGAKKTVPLSKISNDKPDLLVSEGNRIFGYDKGDTNLIVYPNDVVYIGNVNVVNNNQDDPKAVRIVGRMTVEPNTVIIDISNRYASRGDTESNIAISKTDEYSSITPEIPLNNNAGRHKYSLSSAYTYGVRNNGSGGLYDSTVVPYSTAKNYVKLRFHSTYMQDVAGYGKTDQGKTDYGIRIGEAYYSGSGYFPGYCTIGKVKEGMPYVGYSFVSHSIVTVDSPDEDGYIEVWVLEDDMDSIRFSTIYSRDIRLGGSVLEYVFLPYKFKKIQLSMAYPKSGVTLYKVPSGTYTVEVNNSSYQLSGNTLKVTNTSSLQKMNLKLSKKSASTTKTTTTAKTTTTTKAATTTTATTTKPSDTTTTTTTTTVPDSSVPDDTSSEPDDTSSEEDSSSESEPDSSSVKEPDSSAPADDSSSQTDSSVAESDDSSDNMKMILIIGGIALAVLIIAVLVIRRIVNNRIDKNN